MKGETRNQPHHTALIVARKLKDTIRKAEASELSHPILGFGKNSYRSVLTLGVWCVLVLGFLSMPPSRSSTDVPLNIWTMNISSARWNTIHTH